MHCTLSLLLLASLAPFTLAAPTPDKAPVKRSFKAASKGNKLPPAEEIAHAFCKHGWEFLFPDSDADSQQQTWPIAFGVSPSSAAIAYGYPSSSVPYAAPSSGGYGFGSPPSSMAPLPNFPAPFSSAPAVSSVPASSSAPAVSSTPAYSSIPVISSGPAAPSTAAPSSSTSSTAAAPSPSSPSTGGEDEGEVSALPEENESQYLAPVSIGGQKLNLNFDTGSADLWVFSSKMPEGETAGHSVYDPSKSLTFTNYQGGSWQIQYGDGSTAEGSVGYDTVDVGGVVAEKQAVELAEYVSRSFLSTVNSDGLLGLGFSSINTVQPQQQKTFFDNVKGDLDQPVFTADLEEDKSGTYEFGSIDSSKYTGEIHWTSIDNSDGFWQFESTTYTVGGKQMQCQTCSPAIADTGTSLVLVDQDVADAYYKQVQGAKLDQYQGGYVYPCDTQLPDFGVAIGKDYTATIPGSGLNYASLEDVGNNCFGGVQGTGSSQPGVQIFGDVLFKHFFAVFDGGNNRFGLADKA